MSGCKRRIEIDRARIVPERRLEARVAGAVPVKSALQVCVIRLAVTRADAANRFALFGHQLDRERLRDSRRDIGLQ